jgi:cytochrome oxidase assembly protein ShyY1
MASMTRLVRSPAWLAAHLLVITVIAMFVTLGTWQLRRLDERRLENAVGFSRSTADPVDLAVALDAAGADVASLEHRRVFVAGRFDPDHEALVRSQVLDGRAGFHVLTPLVLADGRALIVNRGWIPLELDRVPVAAAPPPAGELMVEGVVGLSRSRGSLGPQDAPGATTVSRIDLTHLDSVVPASLMPVWVQLEQPASSLPVPLEPPSFEDDGPHLAYALQWFSFGVITLVGYGALLRRATRSGP